MPLPRENLVNVHILLSEVCTLLEKGPETNPEKEIIESKVLKVQEILEEEQMDILRFGDVTRTADHTFEPYQSIKKASEILKDFDFPEFEKDEVDDLGEVIKKASNTDFSEAIETIEDTINALSDYMDSEVFPPAYLLF